MNDPEVEFLRSVVESLPSYIAVLDDRANILRANRAWCRLAGQAGVNADRLIGRHYLEVCRGTLLDEAICARAQEGLTSVLAGKKPRFACDYEHGAGPDARWFELHIEPLARPEGGAIVSHLDVTARKRAQIQASNRLHELAHVSRAMTMGALAGSAAHELNQPLTAILSNAQAGLRFLAADPPRTELVQEI
ncbi:MAG: PAS domain-containing protein, partial [Longimicrobiales bacterium]